MASNFRNNLHIVLCMSPVGSAFRTRCRMFPSLVNCCTIDWFTEWPPEALLSVSQSAFAEVDLGTDELKVCLTPRQETDSSLWILCLRSSKFEKFRNGKQVTKLHSQSRNYTQQILGKHLIRLHFSCLRGIVSCIYRKYVCSLNITMGSTFFVQQKIAEMCMEIHTSVSDMAERLYNELKRRYYTTPTSYLELITLYLTMIKEKKK